MRLEVERGAAGVIAVALFGAAVVLAVGGLGVAKVLGEMSGALRAAESGAVAVAGRELAGDPNPCALTIEGMVRCEVDEGVATVTVERDGFRAAADAGPER